MGLLGPLGMGPELALAGIFCTEVVEDEFLGSPERQRREVGRVGTHIGDETALVQALRQTHRKADGEAELARRLLLEGGGGERRGRIADAFLGLDGTYGEMCSDAVLQELACFFKTCETGSERGLDLDGSRRALRVEHGLDAVERLALERHDLLLAVDDEPQGDGLHAAGGELGLDLPPEYRRKLEADETVEHAARLLRVHEVHIDGAGILDGVLDGVLGDLVEDDAPGAGRVETEGLAEVPGDGLSLAVLIGSEPDDG